MRWLLKGMGDWTLIGLLLVTPKTHLQVSDQPILELRQAQQSFASALCGRDIRAEHPEM